MAAFVSGNMIDLFCVVLIAIINTNPAYLSKLMQMRINNMEKTISLLNYICYILFISNLNWKGAWLARMEGRSSVERSKLNEFCLLCQAEEWSPIEQRRLFPLPRILLKLPPEPLPFHPCHPTLPLNTRQGTCRVRPPKSPGFVSVCFGSEGRG